MNTYLMGQNAVYFDKELLENLKDSTIWWRLAWVYRSNWRVLHIDGFEKGYPMPARTGRTQYFFNYTTTGPKVDG